MYSSWYTPEGRESTVPLDHEALHRDEATHKSIQSEETRLTPLDLETIMSNKGVVKFWYLHRPKTMAIVHKNATKLQSVGKAYAVRQLVKKYGVGYTVELAKRDAEKKEQDRLAEMTEEERAIEIQDQLAYDARVAETRRLKREQMEMEAEAARCEAENETFRVHEMERLAEEERKGLEHEAKVQKEKEEALALTLALEEEEKAKQLVVLRAQKEAELALEADRLEAERIAQEEKEETERALAQASLIAARAAQEAEQARVARLVAEKQLRYDQSLSKDVPVIVAGHGRGTVVNYDSDLNKYRVVIEESDDGNYHNDSNRKPLTVIVDQSEMKLDGDRILSPKTLVDTPFGTGEVVGMDPHVGCYQVTNLNHDDANPQAFIQIKDVKKHVKRASSVIIEEGLKMPDEIGLASARIVDSRVVTRSGQKFVQYKLEIQTTNFGTVYCWKRYSTFRALCDRLQKEGGFKKKEIPELPKRHILGNLTQRTIGERAEKLNLFLESAVKAEHLQWGIRVDENIAVYKRRVKRSGTSSTSRSSRR